MDFLGTANRGIRRLLTARGVESRTHQVDGLPVHAYHLKGQGSGPPMLLVHGLGSSANSFYRALFPLAKRFRSVWALDIPGNGFSPLPPSGPLPIRQQVAMVRRFQEQVIGEQVFRVGNSLGGAMSLSFAHEAPQNLLALGLVSPAGARVAPERLEALVRSFEVTSTAQARAMTRRLFHRAPLPVLLFAGELKALYASPTVRSVMAEVRPEDTITEAMLAGLSMPTLLIWGRSEKLLPYEGLHYFRAHLPRTAEVQEVEGFGHMPQMERPQELVARLTAFAQARGLL
jgi:pimeloyl-ACP methyl ester carboxylesterase